MNPSIACLAISPHRIGCLLKALLFLAALEASPQPSGAQAVRPVRFDVSILPARVGSEAGVQAFTLADVNGDGRDDLIAIDPDADKILVYLAIDGGLLEQSGREVDVLVDGVPELPTSVAVGDVASPFESERNGDADGHADIIVGTDFGAVALLVGDGAGNFSSREEVIEPGVEIVAIALDDFDEDGRLDIAALDFDDGVYLLLNEDGNFDPDVDSVEIFDSEFPIDIVAGEVNGDDSADVVVLDQDAEQLFLLSGDGNGGLSEPAEFSTSSDLNDPDQFPADLALGDVNGDELPDVVVLNSGSFGDLQLLVRTAPTLLEDASFPGPFSSTGLALSDFDGNGFLDAIIVDEDEGAVLLNDDGGESGFNQIGGLRLAGIEGARGVAAGDIDGDRRPDFVSLDEDGSLFRVAINQGVGTPTPGTPPTRTRTPTTPPRTGTAAVTPTPTPPVGVTATIIRLSKFAVLQLPTDVGPEVGVQAFTLADVNEDDRDDLIAINTLAERVLVYLTLEDGTLGQPREFDVLVDGDPEDPTSVTVGDVASPFESEDDGDVDGNADIVVGTEDGSVAILVGDGTGGFASREEAIDPGLEIVGVGLADMDEDGSLDIVALDLDDGVLVLLNEDGNFDPDVDPFFLDDSFEPVDIALGDIDGDDHVDAVVIDEVEQALFLLTGDGEGALSDPTQLSTTSDLDDLEQFPADVSIADLDDDGSGDVVVANSGVIGTLQLLVRRGPDLRTSDGYSAPFGMMSLAVADFDGNRFEDAILVSRDEPGVLLPDNGGAGGFPQFGGFSVAGIGPSRGVAPGDLNDDGRADFVALNVSGDTFYVATNLGLETPTPSPTDSETPTPMFTSTRTASDTATPFSPTLPLPTPTRRDVSGDGCSIEPSADAGDGLAWLVPSALALAGLRRSRRRAAPARC